MLNSGKKICAWRDKKNKYSNSCVVQKKILNETKNHNPPFKLNGRSLSTQLTISAGFCVGLGVFDLVFFGMQFSSSTGFYVGLGVFDLYTVHSSSPPLVSM